MADTQKKADESYSDAETAARAEATPKRMLATPHEKHKSLGAKKTPARKPPIVGKSGSRAG